jgi:DNA-binding Xre family transcriptional regulator
MQSLVPQQRAKKELAEGRKLSLEVMSEETDISKPALQRLTMAGRPVERVDASIMGKLCEYFGCGVGDLLVYVPSDKTPSNQEKEN